MNPSPYAPPPVPPGAPEGTLARALRGPVVLLTLGVLLMLDQHGMVGFHRTWPVLLILIGLFKLAEHLGSKTSEPENR